MSSISNRSYLLLAGAAIGSILLIGAAYTGIGPFHGEQSQNQEYNRADVMFMGMMIIHHDQAIQMAEMAPERTENENILALADNISEAQRSENEKMARWLEDLGMERPTDGHRMAGMASQTEIAQLRNSTGTEFDQLFAELMIEHHTGGIQMAQGVVENGRSEKVRDLAEQMITVQQQENEKMRQWQETWS